MLEGRYEYCEVFALMFTSLESAATVTAHRNMRGERHYSVPLALSSSLSTAVDTMLRQDGLISLLAN